VNTLARRIRSLPFRQPHLTPAKGATPTPAVNASHGMQVSTPGTVGLTPLSALVTSDGAMIPATGPGQWDQLVAAGRIR
jgi:hypothetical protein